jgi:cytochrome b involved in lipid metabolism
MKKIPLLFLISLIIFTSFIVYSLVQSPSARQNTVMVAPTTTVTSSPSKTTNPSLCIITINGQRYDVTQYQYQHSGGNIFTCGTDMTAIFNGKHSQRYLNMMQQYLVP